MVVIGDVHGKVAEYERLIKGHWQSIQVGDFGFKKAHDWHMKNVGTMSRGWLNHVICFGNHDYIPYLNHIHSCHDFMHRWEKDNIMTIRGAESIDKAQRTIGVDWWPEEEISYARFKEVIMHFHICHPRIIVSHDCPAIVREKFFGIRTHSRTATALQQCFELWQPDLWIFGHHHRHKDEKVEGTRFICLEELETFSL